MLAVAALALSFAAAACSGSEEAVEGRLAGPAPTAAPTTSVDELPTPEPTPTPEGPVPIVIVTLLGETGVMETLDGAAVSGVLGEVQRINDTGGLLGRPVVVRRFDTNSRTSIIDREGRRVVDSMPDLIITSCDVEFSLPVLEMADDAGLVTISPCSEDAGYATGAYGSRNFSLGAPERDRGLLAGAQAHSLYGPTAMVLRDTTSPEALAFCDGFEEAYEAAGGTILYADEFSYDTPEPLQDRLTESAPPTSLIALCSHAPGGVDGAPSIVSLLRTIGFQAPIVSGSSVDQVGWFAAVPQLNDLLFVSWSSVYGNDPDDQVNEMIGRARDVVDQAAEDLQDALVAFDQAQVSLNSANQAWERAFEAGEVTEADNERLNEARVLFASAQSDRDVAATAAQARIGGATILGAESVAIWEQAVMAANSVEPARVASALGSFSNRDVPTGPLSFVAGARLDDGRRYRIMRVLLGQLTVLEVASVN